MFEEIIFDLDTQRIVDFRLKAWADRYIVLRAALYEAENGDENSTKGMCTPMPHTRFELVFSP